MIQTFSQSNCQSRLALLLAGLCALCSGCQGLSSSRYPTTRRDGSSIPLVMVDAGYCETQWSSLTDAYPTTHGYDVYYPPAGGMSGDAAYHDATHPNYVHPSDAYPSGTYGDEIRSSQRAPSGLRQMPQPAVMEPSYGRTLDALPERSEIHEPLPAPSRKSPPPELPRPSGATSSRLQQTPVVSAAAMRRAKASGSEMRSAPSLASQSLSDRQPGSREPELLQASALHIERLESAASIPRSISPSEPEYDYYR